MENSELNVYYKLIAKQILSGNSYGITQTSEWVRVRTMTFTRERFFAVVDLLKAGGFDSIADIQDDTAKPDEFLDIDMFTDQQQFKYVVLTYDNIMLEQDPEVLEVIRL